MTTTDKESIKKQASIIPSLGSTSDLQDFIIKNRFGCFKICIQSGRILESNDLFAHVLGFQTAEELKSVKESFFERFLDIQTAASIQNQLENHGKVRDIAARIFQNDGTKRWGRFSAIIQPELGWIEGCYEDETEQKRLEYALKSSEIKFRMLIEHSKEAIVVIQSNRFIYGKPRGITRYKAEEVVGMSVSDTIHADDWKKVEHELQRCLQLEEEVSPIQFRLIAKNKQPVWVQTKPVAVTWEGEKAVLCFIEDISRQQRMENLLVQTEKMMVLGGMAAGIAHEINNPLGAILNSIQNIKRRFSPDFEANLKIARQTGVDLIQLSEYLDKRNIGVSLDIIRNAGQKAADIISNILLFSRKSAPEKTHVEIESIVENALEMARNSFNLKKRFDFKSIRIIREFAPSLPAVFCYETEIEQVFLNLLNNAAWAMINEPGNHHPVLIIRTIREDNQIRIDFEDNGPGMEEEMRQQVFEPFFTTKPIGEGTGLGLFVTSVIINQHHHGTIDIDSEPDKGTRFTIRLPLTTDDT